ncbi:LOW QUALITY PROTEIN: coiled-coil domain-containing protein 87 [Salvelinus fontinalis]|uniref:LOW QUALITY PROTEIN: coiled-coil domain-containing protein 87 n=1 Tax=Salvelinus fontinalis TaxID=8038 RepID=UPI0024869794|nr:LOW QUALITY PROTEIN: coiled-coil domain-containing protein 87 [Salvelinus fontinalis]
MSNSEGMSGDKMKVVGRLSRAAEAKRRVTDGQDMLTSMTQMVACTQDIQQRYRSILGPLSLFFQSKPEGEKRADRVQEERPVSPSVSEGVKTNPTSLADMCQQLQYRIQEHSVLHSTPVEDQQALVAVMTSELGLIWQDLKGLMDEPTLNQEENMQLQAETCQEVLRICQELYLNYLHLLDRLRRRAVFSDQANRSRLGAQMSIDCTSLLNVHSIRRSVAAGIKVTRRARLSAERPRAAGRDLEGAMETHTALPCKLDFGLTLQTKAGCKKSGAIRQGKNPMERDLREMTEKMGDMDLEQVYDLMPCHLELITNKDAARASLANVSQSDEKPSMYYHGYTRLKGCSSMPDLQRETLLEELEMEALPARPQSPLVLLATGPCSRIEKPIDPAHDLRRLLQDRVIVDQAVTDSDTDLPPLIKALAWRSSTKLQQLTHTLQKQEEEGEKRERYRVPVEEPEHPQGAVENVALSHGSLARTAAARVSDRVLRDTINIHTYPPVYNYLTKELELSSVQWLDRNLFAGEEIKEVYKELSKSKSTQYLNFDEDPMIEPALTNIRWSLKKKNHQRFINPQLKRQNTNAMSHRKRTEIPADHKKPEDQNSRAYTAWLQWWKTDLSVEDYLRYITNQDSDYLWAAFHLYDSGDSDDEEDERRRLLQLRRDERKKRRRQKMEALKGQKQEYVTGVWNVNTVLLGGLWKEPHLEEEEESPDEEITSPKQKAYKRTVSVGSKEASQGGVMGEGDQVQSRLERIWTLLCLPDTYRLDMAIKYSSHARRDQLEEAMAAWARAARLIQQRESLLARLELFERDASDPNRFFLQGYRGTSLARMNESKHRSKLNSQICSLEKVLSKILHHITDSFHDTVTYKGRPYREKMRWDRIEMLYWLQQERRVQALERVVEGRGSLPTRLPPLNPKLRLYPGTHPTPQGHTPTLSQRPHPHTQPLQPNPAELSVSSISLNVVSK